MEITEVKIFPVRDQKLRAFVSIVFDGSFMVNDIKVINGKDGLFISMPSRRKKNGRFKDIAHPLNNETRRAMEERIIAEYRQVTEGGDDDAPAEPRPTAARQPAPPAAAPAPAAASAAAAEPEPAAQPVAGDEASEPPATATESEPPASEDGVRPDGEDGKSLEEVAEAHLSDSYWTT